VPDSNVQVANSFGKLVLKSLNDKDGGSNNDLDDDLDDHMTINGDDPDPFNEFAMLSSNKAFASTNSFLDAPVATPYTSAIQSRTQFRPTANAVPAADLSHLKWQPSSENVLAPAERRSFNLDQPANCIATGSSSSSDRNAWLNNNLNQYLDRKSPDLGQFKVIKVDEGTKSETQSNSGFSDTYEEAFRRRTPQTKPKNNHENLGEKAFSCSKSEDTLSEEELSQMIATSKPFVPGKILFQQPAQQTAVANAGPLKANYQANKGSVSSANNSGSDTDGSNTQSNTPPSPVSTSSSSSPSNAAASLPAPASFKKQILNHQTQIIGKEKITNF
jgi:hypothetical protein